MINPYQKKFIMQENKSLLLTNPIPALEYIESMLQKLLAAPARQEERAIKLEILRDFEAVYAYDTEHADWPEPFGHFDSQEEKTKFMKRKILNQDFGLYLAGIFVNFHEKRYERDGKIPVLRCPRTMIDYNELYDRAASEYYGTLLGWDYPVKIKEEGELVCRDAAALKDESDDKTLHPRRPRHAVGTSYILPSLIEHFLGLYLQNRLLFSGMTKLLPILQSGAIEMDQEEQDIIRTLTGGSDHIVFQGTQEYIMGKVYGVLVRAGVLEDTQDHAMILTGTGGKRRKMLGTMLHSDYARSQVCPEYMALLIHMFDTSEMNIRNNMMHGSSETFDYLAIGVAAVMMQVLWDIASEDLFVCTQEELLKRK